MSVKEKLSKVEILSELAHFHGGDEFYKVNSLFPHVIMTEGVKFVADSCGAWWMLDVLLSYQTERKVRVEEFQVAKFTVMEIVPGGRRSAFFELSDGDDNVLATQEIPMTDFPLDEITFYFTNGTILLPSEN